MTVDTQQEVRVRIAPSPTGFFHFGTARTALFNWLFARGHGGKFILRIEDTDTERSEKKYEAEITSGLLWLGLDWDEGPEFENLSGEVIKAKGEYGPYRQSERIGVYAKYLRKLLDEERAYYCYCTKEELEAERQAMLGQGLPPKYSGHCGRLKEKPPGKEPQVIRFRTLEAEVEFKDVIRGNVSFNTGLFGDMVIAKDLETPLYNFAAVIDDYEMKISHVIRGEDHLPNTPKQILLRKALGFPEPAYAHLPLILGRDRAKLSKRYLDTSLLEYEVKGYLPEAIVNFLALLGWHPKDEREIFSLEDLVRVFDLKRVQKAGAVFDEEKLDWTNAEHIKKLDDEELVRRLEKISVQIGVDQKIFSDKEFLEKVMKIEKERLKNLAEFFEFAGFFFGLPEYEPNLLVWQKESTERIRTVLEETAEIVKNTKGDRFEKKTLAEALTPLIKKEGRGVVLWPLRVAVSGRPASPDPLDIMEVLGFEESVRRITIALDKLHSGW